MNYFAKIKNKMLPQYIKGYLLTKHINYVQQLLVHKYIL
jgi:hypothetical protein